MPAELVEAAGETKVEIWDEQLVEKTRVSLVNILHFNSLCLLSIRRTVLVSAVA